MDNPEVEKAVIRITSISGEDYNNLELWDKNDADKTHPFVCISCNRRFRTNQEVCECGGL